MTGQGDGRIRLLSAGAVSEIVRPLGEAYRRSTGIEVAAEFTRSPLVRERIGAGEPFDLAITTKARVAALTDEGRILPGTAAILARSGIGVAVKAGQPKPDISSVEAFVRTLRAARSIACADPSFGTASGLYLVELFERLGLSAELKPKIRLVGTAGGKPLVVGAAVASGEAEIAIQQTAEIVAVPGIDLVGPLPAGIQHTTEFSVGVCALAGDAISARAFAGFLTSEEARPVIIASSMEPV